MADFAISSAAPHGDRRPGLPHDDNAALGTACPFPMGFLNGLNSINYYVGLSSDCALEVDTCAASLQVAPLHSVSLIALNNEDELSEAGQRRREMWSGGIEVSWKNVTVRATAHHSRPRVQTMTVSWADREVKETKTKAESQRQKHTQ